MCGHLGKKNSRGSTKCKGPDAEVSLEWLEHQGGQWGQEG